MELPTKLFTDYRAGIISRQQFIQQFGERQKAHGLNYDCKGTADALGTYVTYRGRRGTIRGGCINWCGLKAKSVFDFCRAVDFALNAEGGRK